MTPQTVKTKPKNQRHKRLQFFDVMVQGPAKLRLKPLYEGWGSASTNPSANEANKGAGIRSAIKRVTHFRICLTPCLVPCSITGWVRGNFLYTQLGNPAILFIHRKLLVKAEAHPSNFAKVALS